MKDRKRFAAAVATTALLLALPLASTSQAGIAPVCTITGTSASETLTGTAGNDVICAKGGHDRVFGLAGNDTLVGEDGNDALSPGSGVDTLIGGLGSDRAVYNDSVFPIVASLQTNTATGDGADTFAEVEYLRGSPQGDTLTGNGLDNVLDGANGDDMVTGGAGEDVISGRGGSDTLISDDDATGGDFVRGGRGPAGAFDDCQTDFTDDSFGCENQQEQEG